MAHDLNKKPKNALMAEMNEGLVSSLVETIMPKIKPFIEPAMAKFNEFLGNDEKTIIIRKLGENSASVIIFDNNKLDEVGYNISYNSNERKFTCEKQETVFTMESIDGFINKLLTGEFSK